MPQSAPPPLIDTWYQAHHGWLSQWLRRKLRCSAQAADLAHDTFVRVLGKSAQELQQVSEPRAWLTTIAHGILVNHCRRRDLEQAWLAELSQLPHAHHPSVEAQQLILEALCQVDRLLASLPRVVRHTFLLSQLDGLTYREIAAQLGISERSVKNHMARAMLACLSLADACND
ncbi:MULTISPECIES: sigma-70 family RNA polymerase sigma factor [Chitinibacter]|uniref:sigma-70 family RNA polymerase sigma factor n=1 Tax=Chitinibacter TaxID=230666 RepID=UPI000647DB32|nr:MULTISPECIES: sigma-70 family RNA polymerase sigma factor [Chitinibacter]